ncbi:hypothetical protein JYT85_01760 [Desulfocapsa sp. AH-315-G09]|uniref:Uncharacterized protein n=1 Tax=Desulfotalea psychrophila TaxID=84980 RepID=A0ABS3AZI7_9BACT|nr:hypothetical protein [Desulfocapsa sp.]MBN4052851.1 hypothetical protein [bacterium AH-315-K15]MBN4060131.1 hypothetical protein [Desulfotalea psychrophila]MBN4065354.1 hypothetical protein [Desulfocapsa sp. AH-315-G09]MBN4068740.1 hypothetical protein [Desulfotalea psychrophila]
MSDVVKFLPLEEAKGIVAAIQEEENIHHQGRRILTVYNHDNRELCWFDFEELEKAVGNVPKDQQKEFFQDYILKHIPDWALDI